MRDVRLPIAVYNLEVEGNRNYFASGVLVHNCEHLEAITYGKLTKLIINVPPGTMKTLSASVFWPLWEWGPAGLSGLRYLTASYRSDLAVGASRKMRDIVLSDWYQARWPTGTKLTREGEDDFENTAKGGRKTAAFNSLTGDRGDRLIIDDPHSTEGAESIAEREKAKRIFLESVPSRLNDAVLSAILIIMQRLNVDDVTGLALANRLGYELLMLPMEFEMDRKCSTSIGWSDPRTYEGELLFPARFPRNAVDVLKSTLGSFAYAGQYQQRPTLREGGMFKRRWFSIVTDIPASVRWVRRWDLAASKEQMSSNAAYTVGLLLGRAPGGRFIIGDVARLRAEGQGVRTLIKETAGDDGQSVAIGLPQDPGQAGKIQASDMINMLAGYVVRADRETGDKVARAEPVAAQAEAGHIDLLKGDWNEAFLDEACFAGGTLVSTINGPQKIEDVQCGELVMTRKGWRKVRRSLLTNPSATLLQLTFSNGSQLSVTPNHPILVLGFGFKIASQIRAGDGVLRFIGASPSSSILATPTPRNAIFPAPSGNVKSISIATFGSVKLVQYLRATTSTIEMKTLKTICSTIWNVFTLPSIPIGIKCGNERSQKRVAYAWSAVRSSSPFSPREPEPVRSAARMQIRSLKDIRISISTNAPSAKSSSEQPKPGRFIAASHVLLKLFTRIGGFPRSLVNSAARCLSRRRAQDVFAADLAVSETCTLRGTHPVYNLEVEDEHEYVAGGILVHNCTFPGGKFKDQIDALSGAFGMFIGKGVYGTLEEQIVTKDVKVLATWPRIAAIDVTGQQVFMAWACFNPNNQTAMIYDTLIAARGPMAVHAAAMRKRCPWAPVLFDMKGDGRSKEEGVALAVQLSDAQIDLLTVPFDEEASVSAVGALLEEGRLRVFESVYQWFDDYRSYARDEKGKIGRPENGIMRCTGLIIASGGKDLAITENRANSNAKGFEMGPEATGRSNSSTGY